MSEKKGKARKGTKGIEVVLWWGKCLGKADAFVLFTIAADFRVA